LEVSRINNRCKWSRMLSFSQEHMLRISNSGH
jgi:hypothetical protein